MTKQLNRLQILIFLVGDKTMLKVKALVKAGLVAVTLVSILSGCATSPKVHPVQMADNQLSKEQLVAELNKLDMVQQEIDSKKGVTGTNVASFLFWMPGLAYTYYDASEASKLVEQRRSHLTSIYNQKMSQHGAKSSNQRRS